MEDHILDIIKHHVPGFIGENELKQYAVILPLQLINGEWHIILEKRAADMTVQPGEIFTNITGKMKTGIFVSIF